jgi:hypothetical protein
MSHQRKHGLSFKARTSLDGPSQRQWTEDARPKQKPTERQPKSQRDETEAHGPESAVVRAWRAEP